MTVRIAVSGKGGVGKTTVVCGILEYLLSKDKVPVLLVDADPNSNLAENLGLKYELTIADIREELRSGVPEGFSKADYINIRLQEAVVEYKGFDLIVMGRPEGKECYCYVNELLRSFLSNLSKVYKYVLMDTEAGLEHLSRRTTDNIDYLFIISTLSKVSIDTGYKILDTINKLKLKINNVKTIINFVEDKQVQIEDSVLNIIGMLPKDERIYQWSQENVSLLGNIKTTNFYMKLAEILDKVIT